MENTIIVEYEAKLSWRDGREIVFNDSFEAWYNNWDAYLHNPEVIKTDAVADARVKAAKKAVSIHKAKNDPDFDKFEITKLSVSVSFGALSDDYKDGIRIFDKERGFQNHYGYEKITVL